MSWHGYVLVDARDHPFSNKDGYVLEHRLVIEECLRTEEPGSSCLVTLGNKRYLDPDLVVHHVDGVKDNNGLDNLVVLTVEEHTHLHHGQGDIRPR